MNVVAIIPARYGSTRFPGKPLAMVSGKPMLQWVYENALKCDVVDRVIVATDNSEIARTVEGFGGEVFETAAIHETGSDRVAEVAKDIDAQVVINIQGDEPLLPAAAIEEAALPLLNNKTDYMATLKTKIRDKKDIVNPNIVKVVTDHNGFALYFSRSPVPFVASQADCIDLFRHIGIYVYKKEFLLEFAKLPQSFLERAEKLEQLRALENGYSIMVKETDYYPVGVDVPEDIALVEEVLMGK